MIGKPANLLLSLILGFLFAFYSPPAHSAKSLSWSEMRTMALENNPSLQSTKSTIDASAAELKSTYGSFLPALTATSTRAQTTSTTNTAVGDIEAKKNTDQLALSASINVFNGFASLNATRRAEVLKKQADISLKIQSSSVRGELRQAYFNLYIQQERARLFEKIVKREEQNLKLMSIKYEAGTEARWNLHKTKADHDLAKFNLSSTAAGLRAAKEDIRRLLSLGEASDFEIEAPQEDLLWLSKISEEDLIKSSPRLEKLRLDIERYEKDKRIAQAAFLPSVDLAFTKARDHLDDGTGNAMSDTWSIKATWNIFDGFTDKYKVQKAGAQAIAADYDLRAAETNLLTDFRSKTETLRLAAEKISLTKASREAAEDRVRTVSAQYRSGLKTYLDWEQAETQLNESEQVEIQTKKEAYFALADLEQLIGMTLREP
jgi:outer membrane protein TolC